MEEHTRETLEEVADVVFHGQLEEKRPWLLLVLVSLAPSVPQDVAFGTNHIRRLEDDGAILAEVVRDDVVLRGTKHGEDLVNLSGEEVLGEKQLQEVEHMLEGRLGEVGGDEEDEEGAHSIGQSHG